jgi:hypothetical protein
MKRIAAAAVLLACLQTEGLAQRSTPRENLGPTTDRAAARTAIIAAEDSRLALPADLHTPGIDTIREKQMEDLRLLFEFARSNDIVTRGIAIRALGRLERREDIPELLPYLTLGPAEETAQALAGEQDQILELPAGCEAATFPRCCRSCSRRGPRGRPLTSATPPT